MGVWVVRGVVVAYFAAMTAFWMTGLLEPFAS